MLQNFSELPYHLLFVLRPEDARHIRRRLGLPMRHLFSSGRQGFNFELQRLIFAPDYPAKTVVKKTFQKTK
jgi:hypothetical protein